MYGSFSGNLTGAIYGAYAGGAEGTAVMETAYHLKGLLVHSCQFQQNFPFHLKYGSNSGREMLWVVSAYSQAVARNTHLVQDSNGFMNAGPGTDMLFREASAHAIASVVSGGDLWTAAPRHNKYRNYATPLEARLAAETGHAIAEQGMSREKACEIVDTLLRKYEGQIAAAPEGTPIQECYEMMKVKPRGWYLDMYKAAREELAGLGVEFPY